MKAQIYNLFWDRMLDESAVFTQSDVVFYKAFVEWCHANGGPYMPTQEELADTYKKHGYTPIMEDGRIQWWIKG
jgi:hypothetical protein